MRDIADCLTLRRLRGGVKIRASEFLGGGGMPPIIARSPPPATASRSHPPPQAAEGKNSFFVKKRISILAPSSIPAKAGISAATAAFADRRHWCFRFAEISRWRGKRFPLSREWKKGAGIEEGDGSGMGSGNGKRGREWKGGVGMGNSFNREFLRDFFRRVWNLAGDAV